MKKTGLLLLFVALSMGVAFTPLLGGVGPVKTIKPGEVIYAGGIQAKLLNIVH